MVQQFRESCETLKLVCRNSRLNHSFGDQKVAALRVAGFVECLKECDIIRRWQRALESVDFRLAEATRGLLDNLLHSAESLQSDRECTLHRDFYEQQFVYDGQAITLLDLDTLARGDPCVDLGNLLHAARTLPG